MRDGSSQAEEVKASVTGDMYKLLKVQPSCLFVMTASSNITSFHASQKVRCRGCMCMNRKGKGDRAVLGTGQDMCVRVDSGGALSRFKIDDKVSVGWKYSSPITIVIHLFGNTRERLGSKEWCNDKWLFECSVVKGWRIAWLQGIDIVPRLLAHGGRKPTRLAQ